MGSENRSWTVQVYDALGRDEVGDGPSQLLIWKVPFKLMINNVGQYEPLYWRIGLHHCLQSLHSNDIEVFKVKIAKALQLTGDRWNSFCKRVVLEPKEYWEAVYHHSPYTHSFTIDEIRCRLSLDALFLVVFMQHRGRGNESLGSTLQTVWNNPILEIYSSSIGMGEALNLVENQIPMELLERVVDILVMECKENVGDMQEWKSEDWQGWSIGACVWWKSFLEFIGDANKASKMSKRVLNNQSHVDSYCGVHILDSAYRMLCGWKSLEAVHVKSCPPRFSATTVEACGVTIKVKEFTYFEDIFFEEGCLLVPFLQVHDGTGKYLRNLIVHESLTRLYGRRHYIAMSYTYFMEGLMRTKEDVILLEKRGVLSIKVSSYDIAVDMWKHVNYNITRPFVSDEFFTMMTNVINYTKKTRNKYRFEFKKQFCSRPWIPLSYVAATIVTIATLIQTYIAIIGSNGMKPHFAPQH